MPRVSCKEFRPLSKWDNKSSERSRWVPRTWLKPALREKKREKWRQNRCCQVRNGLQPKHFCYTVCWSQQHSKTISEFSCCFLRLIVSSWTPHKFILQWEVAVCAPLGSKVLPCHFGQTLQQRNDNERLEYVDNRCVEIHNNPKMFSEKSIFNPKKILSKQSKSLAYFETKP